VAQAAPPPPAQAAIVAPAAPPPLIAPPSLQLTSRSDQPHHALSARSIRTGLTIDVAGCGSTERPSPESPTSALVATTPPSTASGGILSCNPTHPPRRAQLPPLSMPSPGAGRLPPIPRNTRHEPPAVRVDISSIALSAALKQDADVTDVWVEVDLLELVEDSQLRTQAIHKGAGDLDFGFSTSVVVAGGSKEEAVLRTALASRDPQDADVYFVLKTLTRNQVEREIGQGYVNLQTMLREGRDATSASVDLRARGMESSAGALMISLFAVDVLRNASGRWAVASRGPPHSDSPRCGRARAPGPAPAESEACADTIGTV